MGAGQQTLPTTISAPEARGARAEKHITSSTILDRPATAPAAAGTPGPDLVLRRADDDLWVATADGEYAGMVTRRPDGFHVHDRFTRPVTVVAALEHARRHLSAPPGRPAGSRRAQPPSRRRPAGRGTRTRARGPVVAPTATTKATGTGHWVSAP